MHGWGASRLNPPTAEGLGAGWERGVGDPIGDFVLQRWRTLTVQLGALLNLASGLEKNVRTGYSRANPSHHLLQWTDNNIKAYYGDITCFNTLWEEFLNLRNTNEVSFSDSTSQTDCKISQPLRPPQE